MSLIDDYLAKVAVPQKSELERIRKIVKQFVPEAEEAISYGIPAFKYKQKYLVGYAAFKDHLSVFPTSGPIEALKEKLTDFKLARGTIQFTIEKPIPEQLIKEILLVRMASITKT